MKTEQTTIQCPSCGDAINVNDILLIKLVMQLKKSTKKKLFKKNKL
jgi:hypothetical protein